jgi:hypothetical protein
LHPILRGRLQSDAELEVVLSQDALAAGQPLNLCQYQTFFQLGPLLRHLNLNVRRTLIFEILSGESRMLPRSEFSAGLPDNFDMVGLTRVLISLFIHPD